MYTRNVAFKRIGAPKAIGKVDDFLTVQVSLDGNPDWDWIECFKHPSTWTHNEAYPSRATVIGDTITFTSSESGIKANVEWMDKYIQQANDSYNRIMAERSAEEKGQQERAREIERKRKEELDRINETLKDI
jgi:hypothetical protein